MYRILCEHSFHFAGMQLLLLNKNCMVSFKECARVFSRVTVRFNITASICEWLFCPHTHQQLVVSRFFLLVIPMYSDIITVVIYFSWMTNDVENLSMCLFAIYMLFFRTFSHFLIKYIFLLSFRSALYILDKSFYRYMIIKYFLLFYILYLYYLNNILYRENVFNLVFQFMHTLCLSTYFDFLDFFH